MSCPKSIATEHAVFVEPIGAACEILDQVKIPKGEAVGGARGWQTGPAYRASAFRHRARECHQFGRHRDKLRIAERVGVTGEVSKKLPVSRVSTLSSMRPGRPKVCARPSRCAARAVP